MKLEKKHCFCALLVAALSSGAAHARSVPIYDEGLVENDPNVAVSATFQVNEVEPNLGRAWIEVTVTHNYSDTKKDPEQITSNRNVSGLRYDVVSEEILFQEEGQASVVCARVVERHLLLLVSKSIEPTGHCVLKASTERKQQDDGFHIRTRTYAKVVLEIEDP